MRHFCRHTNAFAKRWVGVNSFANIYGVCTHLNSKRDFTNHVTRMCADHAATQNLSVAVGFG